MAFKTYNKAQLLLVWNYVRNNHAISGLWNIAGYEEDVAKEMYYQAYSMFGLGKTVFKANGSEMPKPTQFRAAPKTVKNPKSGCRYVKKPKPVNAVAPRPATRLYSAVEPPDESIFRKTPRPVTEYTNSGYLALQKKYGT